jgi:hypothetical protein
LKQPRGRRSASSIVLSIASFTASASVCAEDVTRHPCAEVRDSADRLACYDKAFGKPAQAPDAQFGLPPKQPSPEAAEPDTVTAAVTAIRLLHDGKFVVTLDNAQVWSQSEINSQADVRVGDSVTVRRGALRSYLLVTKGGIATRVKRVK